MAYKQTQGRSEFSKTGRGITSKLAGPDPITDGNINITKTTSKRVAAKRKAKERKNKKNKNKRNNPLDGLVTMPGKAGDNAKMVKLPGTGGGNPLDGMVKF